MSEPGYAVDLEQLEPPRSLRALERHRSARSARRTDPPRRDPAAVRAREPARPSPSTEARFFEFPSTRTSRSVSSELTRHRSPWVRACATYVVGRMGRSEASELPVEERLADDYDLARLNAIEAIGRLGDRNSMALLESLPKQRRQQDERLRVASHGQYQEPQLGGLFPCPCPCPSLVSLSDRSQLARYASLALTGMGRGKGRGRGTPLW